jgi:hypothetical protein
LILKQQKQHKKNIDIFRMLKHLNMKLRFMGKALKRYKETGQVQLKKKTGMKRTVRTKEQVGKEGDVSCTLLQNIDKNDLKLKPYT